MKYLKKSDHEKLAELSYAKAKDRGTIRKFLIEEQYEFCAYSERFIKQTDSVHIEHFDGSIKNTNKDNYKNWYAVLAWLNEHKPKKITPFLPILSPSASDLMERIIFEDNIFKPKKIDDIEAKNLIQYLGWNKKELADDRNRHIKRIQQLKRFFDTIEDFKDFLKIDKENLSFVTGLESTLKVPLFDLVKPPKIK